MKIEKKKIILSIKILILLTPLLIFSIYLIDFKIIVNNEKTTLWINVPSTVECDEEFKITIEAWDEFERLAGSYMGQVSFEIESYNYYSTNEIASSIWKKPDDYKFTSNMISGGVIPAYKIGFADNGKKSFTASITTQGIHYINVVEKNSGNVFRSNPIIVKNNLDKRVYWGDLHGHTLMSDGSGLMNEAYEFARDVSLLDFAALTDHSEHFPRMGDVDFLNLFNSYVENTNNFNDPESFVTLVAYEYTPNYIVQRQDVAYGHLNLYFEGDTAPFTSTLTQYTPDELYSYLKANSNDDFLAWTHHSITSDFSSDYAFYDENINPLIEIYSVHGSSETLTLDTPYSVRNRLPFYTDGYSVRDALKMGRKFGFMGSGDSHDGRLGHSLGQTEASAFNQYPYTLSGYRVGHKYPNGLTGVIASNLDRSSVFNALQTRSCYATTGVNRHYIDFEINGLSVGESESTLSVESRRTPRNLNILVAVDGVSMSPNQETKIEEVRIYKNSNLWKIYDDIDSPMARITETDNSLILGTSYDKCIQKEDGNWYIHERSLKPVNPASLNTGGADYYYIRVLDSNNGAAWVGPIWVEP